MEKLFIHLRCHSAYSLAFGATRVAELAELAKNNKMPAIAITDNSNLFGMLEFAKEAKKNGVQPIIGASLRVKNPYIDSIDDIILLAKDNQGYLNLIGLVSDSYDMVANGFEPHINFALLEKKSNGLIALTAGITGGFGKLLIDNKEDIAEKYLLNLHNIFSDSLYVELNRHGEKEEDYIEEKQINFANKYRIPLVATNQVLFTRRSMHEAHDSLICIANGEYIAGENRKKYTQEYYFKSTKEMCDLFSDIPEAISNTIEIAKRCAICPEEHKPVLPKFDPDSDKDESQILMEQSKSGLIKRLEEENIFQEQHQIYFDRLDFELKIITGMEFSGYFLIVSNFIKWSKNNNIPVGPGRGSGAGSIVAWSLEITDLNPIRFGLLFERFLNPERVSMPDFDIDFCQERRDEVINYVQNKYGYSKVAQIITFGKLQARAVLRDVGRVMQIPYGKVDRISKLVPNNPAQPVTLAQAIDLEPMLKQEIKDDSEVAKLVEIALQLEGLYRHASTHAAGVVIADRDLQEIIALYKDAKSTMPVIQYSMKHAESAGLIKFDFLGLKTLTMISNCCKLIKERGINLDINKIPLNDLKTYEMLSKGLGIGVFQFEGRGMRDALCKLKPDAIEDIIALGALYRPGPMDNIPTYIACKHGLEKPDYLHPKLEEVLKETFGVIIYQEQVMEIAKILSGYSLGSADLLRRAMGKKIKSEMDDQEQMFVSGAVANGVDKDQARSIFNLVAKFAGYGFNKSHAAAYGIISYQTAYLKANYPVEFMIASMNLDLDNTDKLAIFANECKEIGIELLPPDINLSQNIFAIDINNKQAIRYGLAAIKNVGMQAMDNAVIERNNNGLFKDIFNFVERVDSKNLNKRTMENLIKSGAFDKMNENRHKLFSNLELLLDHGVITAREKQSQQISLFAAIQTKQDHSKPDMIDINDWSSEQKSLFEYEVYGFYLFTHPLSSYAKHIAQYSLKDGTYIENLAIGEHFILVAGYITNLQMRISKRGRFGFITLCDLTSSYDIAVYDENILNNRELLGSNKPILAQLDVKCDMEGNKRIIARHILELDIFITNKLKKINIKISSIAAISEIKKYCISGGIPITLNCVTSCNQNIIVDIGGNIGIDTSKIMELKNINGLELSEYC
jgi:DNA polymerase III subunit alpha